MGQKPDDWNVTSLCGEHHALQHQRGEAMFWHQINRDPRALIEEFIKASPRRREIEQIRSERLA